MRLPRLSLLTVVLLLAAASTAVAASVGVVTGLLATSTKTLTRVTCTVTGALNDTYVSESSPTSSTGATASTLTVSISYTKTSVTRTRALVSFSLASCPASIQQNAQVDSATLKLYVSSAPAGTRTYNVFQVTSAWGNTATWNTQPSYAASAESTFSASASSVGWKSIDVTGDLNDYVQSNPTVYPPYTSAANWYGWMIDDEGTTTANSTITSTNSGTTTQRPQLVVTYVY